jgi:hypothetical protein
MGEGPCLGVLRELVVQPRTQVAGRLHKLRGHPLCNGRAVHVPRVERACRRMIRRPRHVLAAAAAWASSVQSLYMATALRAC